MVNKIKNVLKEAADKQRNNKVLNSWKTEDTSRKNEYYGILGSWFYPEKHPADVFYLLREQENLQFGKFDYLDYVKRLNMFSPEKRRRMAESVQNEIAIFNELLAGNSSNIEEFGEYVESNTKRTQYRRDTGMPVTRYEFTAKKFFVILLLCEETFKNEDYQILIETYSDTDWRNIFKTIKHTVYKHYGKQVKRRSASDILETSEQLLKGLKTETIEDYKDETERLKFENENLKNSLELLELTLQELKESMLETIQEEIERVKVEFFEQLNSSQHGNLLDSMVFVEEAFERAKAKNEQLPVSLKPVKIIFKQWSKFIKSMGIEPIETVGTVLEAKYEDIGTKHYIGSPFEADDEVKKVIVKKSGWKLNEQVIANVTVEEMVEEKENNNGNE